MGFVGNYAPCGLSPQSDDMPVIHKKIRPGFKFGTQDCWDTGLLKKSIQTPLDFCTSIVYYICTAKMEVIRCRQKKWDVQRQIRVRTS